eukprot:7505270-Alexandrium_andersonii.AAC.1
MSASLVGSEMCIRDSPCAGMRTPRHGRSPCARIHTHTPRHTCAYGHTHAQRCSLDRLASRACCEEALGTAA